MLPTTSMADTLARIDERTIHLKDAVDRVEKQATLTNGRVTTLERWTARAQGAGIILSFAGPIIAGLIVKFAG